MLVISVFFLTIIALLAFLYSTTLTTKAETVVFEESWESGLSVWRDTPYHTQLPVIVDTWAIDGTHSLRLQSGSVLTTDMNNPNPTGSAYLWAYVKVDSFILPSGFGTTFEGGVFEMRSTQNFVIGFPEIRSTDYGNTFYWVLCWFDMTTGHHYIGARDTSSIQVLPNVIYKVVMGYEHTATHVTLKMWINQETEGVPDATLEVDAPFDYTANNIYAGCCKTQDGYFTSYKYIDCLGFGNSYPSPETSPTPTPSTQPSPTPSVSPSPSTSPKPPSPEPSPSPFPETTDIRAIALIVAVFVFLIILRLWGRRK